jgi:hypothetical protein
VALQLHTTLRNLRALQVVAFTGDAALLRLYTAGYAQMLVEFVCGTPFAPEPVNGQLTLTAIADGVAQASGDAALGRVYKRDSTTIAMQGLTVSSMMGTAHIRLGQADMSIEAGQTVSVQSAVILEGDA